MVLTDSAGRRSVSRYVLIIQMHVSSPAPTPSEKFLDCICLLICVHPYILVCVLGFDHATMSRTSCRSDPRLPFFLRETFPCEPSSLS
ncbi:hypothetical protein BYT27DRAFT_6403443 [Phlegmacium glaucopus]|nr:hypothetical protein BYT27DRAFT_6403443 [Phlegmacium glaucopus]